MRRKLKIRNFSNDSSDYRNFLRKLFNIPTPRSCPQNPSKFCFFSATFPQNFGGRKKNLLGFWGLPGLKQRTEVGIYKRKQENTHSTKKVIKKKRKKIRSRPKNCSKKNTLSNKKATKKNFFLFFLLSCFLL